MRHVALAALLVAACDPEQVGLNQRVFELPSMASAGAGCTTVELSGAARGATGKSGCAPGAEGACLGTSVRTSAGRAEVTVLDRDGSVLFTRTYDAAFLRSGRRDEFRVTGAAGKEQLFRHWGSSDGDGNPTCAPLDDTGEGVPLFF
jgi:hypothetical protein